MTLTPSELSYLLLLVQSDLNRMRIETDHAKAYGDRNYRASANDEACEVVAKLLTYGESEDDALADSVRGYDIGDREIIKAALSCLMWSAESHDALRTAVLEICAKKIPPMADLPPS